MSKCSQSGRILENEEELHKKRNDVHNLKVEYRGNNENSENSENIGNAGSTGSFESVGNRVNNENDVGNHMSRMSRVNRVSRGMGSDADKSEMAVRLKAASQLNSFLLYISERDTDLREKDET